MLITPTQVIHFSVTKTHPYTLNITHTVTDIVTHTYTHVHTSTYALSRTWQTSTDSGKSFSALFLNTFKRGGIGLLLTVPAETEKRRKKMKKRTEERREEKKNILKVRKISRQIRHGRQTRYFFR